MQSSGEKGRFPAQPHQNQKAICEVKESMQSTCDQHKIKPVVALRRGGELEETENQKNMEEDQMNEKEKKAANDDILLKNEEKLVKELLKKAGHSYASVPFPQAQKKKERKKERKKMDNMKMTISQGFMHGEKKDDN